MLLLKESSILDDDVQVLPLHRRCILLEPEPVPVRTLGECFPFCVISVEQHLIPELRLGSTE
jgi:hypothetical protein